MNKPNKHAEVIKAWADGKQIQQLSSNGWVNINPACDTICWGPQSSFRIKPELKDPGIVCRDAFYQAIYPNHTPYSNKAPEWTAAAKAVIDAYKAGELKDF